MEECFTSVKLAAEAKFKQKFWTFPVPIQETMSVLECTSRTFNIRIQSKMDTKSAA